MIGTRRDAIGQEMNLEAEIQKIMRRLIYADVCFKSTNHDLSQIAGVESVLQPGSSAGTERGLLQIIEIFRKHSAYFFRRASKSFRILLGDKYRSFKYLKATD